MAPTNSVYFVQTEINLLLSVMKWSARQGPRSYLDENSDPLHRGLSQLREILNSIADIEEIEPLTFLSPFLSVIRSEETTGLITGLALTAVDKFLSYGLLDVNDESSAPAIEAIAEAVTHARFVGTDPSADEVVLMKILCVLRTLLLIPAGRLLSNESGCEIMQSCFRICFESRLSELLRRTAEYTLMNMVQLLFTRLPELKEDPRWQSGRINKKLKMRKGGIESHKMKRRKGASTVAATAVHSDSSTSINTKSSPNSQTVTTKTACINEKPASYETPTSEENKSYDTCAPDADKEATITEQYNSHILQSPSESGELKSDASEFVPEAVIHNDGDLEKSDTIQCATNVYDMGGSLDNVAAPCEEEMVVNSPEDVSANKLGENEESKSESLAYTNPQGVRFTSTEEAVFTAEEDSTNAEGQTLQSPSVVIPYGLPCVRELLRFLVSLTSSQESSIHVNNMMIHMGLSLLTVALETGADNIPAEPTLLALIKNELTKNVMSLLHSERLPLFAAALRVCFLLFESMRSHLKFQLEIYLQRLMSIITSESEKITFEQREVALESIVQLWRIPGFVTELYLNYDCDLYCSNLFEDLTKLLSKNAFPVSRLLSTHLLSLDALLAVIDGIEQHCHSRLQQRHSMTAAGFTSHRLRQESGNEIDVNTPAAILPSSGYEAACIQSSTQKAVTKSVNQRGISSVTLAQQQSGFSPKPIRHSRQRIIIRPNRMPISKNIPTEEELAATKYKKKLLINGTEKFNVSPKDGITYLQEHGIFTTPLEPDEIALYLRENPRLDKKMIGEYIGSRKNKNILEAFVKSFNFKDVRVDDALRLYLETFRIPGEAPVIQHLLEHFAEQWNAANGNPYANADATFTLSYAILMLNTDQHNVTSRKQNVPMTAEDFKRNLKGMNGGENFEPSLLEKIYYGIREDEIILPSERMGAVKENYLWKVLLRRGATEKGTFIHAASGSFDHDLFTLIWGPTVAALSFVFDKTTDEYIHHKAIAGFRKCAMISAHYGLSDVFDNLVISLCQFTTLLSAVENGYPINLNPESLPYSFGRNEKARLAAKTVFNLAFRHADILRDGWKNLLDCLLQLYKAHLLPEDLIIVEDYINPKKQIRLIEEPQKNSQKQELGMFSSFYLYFTSDSSSHRGPSAEEQECRKKALECIKECHIEQLLEDSKFLQDTSLGELIKALISVTKGDCTHDALSYHYDDDARVFSHELLIRVMLQNRDRMTLLWPLVRNHFYEMAICSMDPSFLLERTVVGLLRLAHRLLRRHEMADQGYTCLDLVGILKPHLLYKLARQVVYGLYELLQTHAASLGHCAVAWRQIFTLLEVCGAGIYTPPERRAEMVERLAFLPQEKYLMDSNAGTRGSTGTIPNVHDPHHDEMASPDSACMSGCESGHGTGSIPNFTAVSDCEPSFHAAADATAWRGYTSDSELHHTTMKTGGPVNSDWILVNSEADIESTSPPNQMEHDVSHSFIHSSGAVILYSEALPPVNQYSIVLQEEFRNHNSRALFKAVEILVFLVRDPAYVNIINFRYCVRALRVFVEASVNGGSHLSTTIHANASARRSQRPTNASSRNAPAGSHKRHGENLQKSSQNRFTANSSMKRNRSNPSGMTTADAHPRQMTSSSSIHSIPRGRGSPSSRNYNSTKQKPHGGYSASASSAESDYEDDLGEEGGNASGNAQRASTKAMNQSLSVQNKNIRMVLQLLELMYTLHTRAASIFTESEKDMDPSSKEGVHGHRATAYPNQVYNNVGATLWDECWCPLLQGIARLCCDARRTIRTQALTYLQRALLAPDLHRLNAGEWEDCFTKVLFPLLSCLLEDVNPADPTGMEETRMRASTLLSKVFLQHLTPLLSLPTFTALWLTILDFMDRYIHVSGSDLLSEAVPESLKNMLLVMDTANVLNRPGANTNEELSSSGPREAVIWRLTWDRISTFLPDLQQELFPESIPTHHVAPLEEEKASVPAPATKESIVALQPRASVNDELKLFHPEHEPLTRSEHETPEPTSDMIDDHSVVIAIPDSPPAEYNNPMDFSEKSIVEEASVVAQNEEPLSEEKLPRGRVVHDL